MLRETGTREEPGTLIQGGALFSLVPLVRESNPKLQGPRVAGALARPNHQPIGGSDPNHQHLDPPLWTVAPTKARSLSVDNSRISSGTRGTAHGESMIV